ncbi:MAG: VIT1/CCC1 transporter family protein [bacterium]|nr:VIT1/CCC1 transporter family protein [bacterium]
MKVVELQRNEITEHLIYSYLAKTIKDQHNKEILNRLAQEEYSHYERLKKITGRDVSPNRLKIWFYLILIKILGITFGLKLMESGEESAQKSYGNIAYRYPEVDSIISDEKVHEKELLSILDEERLRYVGSIVLGLSDALVEFTGTLAGFTFALRDNSLIALTGIITGIAASLSMGASEYLSTKAESEEKSPLKASLSTGATYIFAVFFLVLPYILLKNSFLSFGFTLLFAVILVLFFTFYISVAKELEFKRRFLEMIAIIFGVSVVSFGIGLLVRIFFNIDI